MILSHEKQVCALIYSKRLKELGVEQKSLWWWVTYDDGKEITHRLEKEPTNITDTDCCAYTVAELGWMLPHYVFTKANGLTEGLWEGWMYQKGFFNPSPFEVDTLAKTEANARAKMKIYLLENNIGITNGKT